MAQRGGGRYGYHRFAADSRSGSYRVRASSVQLVYYFLLFTVICLVWTPVKLSLL